MLRCVKKPYPITAECREELLNREDVCPFAIVNCHGGRTIGDRDFLFGWGKRFFLVRRRDAPTDGGHEYDIAPMERDDVVSRCLATDAALLFTKRKFGSIPVWAYNLLVSICQLEKESFSID